MSITDPHNPSRAVELVGVSHKTLPLEKRESLAKMNNNGFLNGLASESKVKELAVIATCNRFEIISVGEGSSQRVISSLRGQLSEELSPDCFYNYQNGSAIKHFLRVAASLDSMVLGEAQILGQVKDAYEKSVENGLAGQLLHHLFQYGFHLAKKIRTNTGIAGQSLSVSYIAVRLAEQIFGSLENQRVLILGSGEIGELTALHFHSRGAGSITVVNRTFERANDLAARVGGNTVPFSELDAALANADIVVGSMNLTEPLLDVNRVKRLRQKHSLFLIDLGVPRNFSPLVGKLDDVYLYDVDDLSKVADENRSLREEAAQDGELLIEYGVAQFERWISRHALTPDIVSMRERISEICEDEVQRSLRGRLTDEQQTDIIHELSHRISQKIAHEATEKMVGHLSGGVEKDDIERFFESLKKNSPE